MFFELGTEYGMSLVHTVLSGRIEAQYPGSLNNDQRPVLAYIPVGHAQCCFLMSGNEAPIELEMMGEPARDQLLPFRLSRLPHSQRTALAHPLSRLHVCAGPPEAESGFGSVVVNRPEVGAWEMFTLTAFPQELAGSAARSLASVIERVLSYGLSAPGLLAAARAENDASTRSAIHAVFSLLTYEESLWFAREVLSDRRLVARWGNQSPGDPWLREALPGLQDWLARGRPPAASRQVLPTTLDLLDNNRDGGRYHSFGHHLNAMARRTIPPRKTLCVVASARNEGVYLLEWIGYHRAIGVEQIFIYSNNNDDQSEALLGALADAGEVVWVDNYIAPERTSQFKAYGHAFSMQPSVLDYRWTLVIDLDEFFVVDSGRFGSIIEYIEWQERQPVDVMKFNWLIFGSSGLDSWQDQPVTERLSHRLPYIDPHVKSMVVSNQCVHSAAHHPILDVRERPTVRSGSGAVFIPQDGESFAAHPDDQTAWINHYFLKSTEEFVWKCSRNRGDERVGQAGLWIAFDGFIGTFMAQHRTATTQEDRRVASGAEKVRAEIQRLKTLPGVAAAHSHVIAAFRERLTHVKSNLRNDRASEADPVRAAFLACVPQ
jgi:hypothetical protein